MVGMHFCICRSDLWYIGLAFYVHVHTIRVV